MVIADDISIKDLLGEWSNYIDWDRFYKNGAIPTSIEGDDVNHTITVTIDFPMIDLKNKGVEK